MKVQKRDGTNERTILIAMIVDKAVLGRIAAKWEKGGLFNNKWSNTIAGWCVDYFEKYDDAPKRAVEGLYESWASKHKGKDVLPNIENFLASLSKEYESKKEEINSDYVVEQAELYFKRIALERLTETIQGDIDSGNVEEAQKRLDSFHPPQLNGAMGINVLQDREAARQAFESRAEILVKYPDALGDFFQNSLAREEFIAFQGPTGVGKSFILADIGWRAMLQRRRVALFVLGDMGEKEVMTRFQVRAAKHPSYVRGGFPAKLKIPSKITRKKGEMLAEVEYTIKEYDAPLTWGQGWKALQKAQERTRSNMPLLKLFVYPSLGLNVKEIEGILHRLARTEEWLADVVLVDYADNLASMAKTTEYRHQINDTWKRLRGTAQKYHCLLVTATQAAVSATRVHTQSRLDFGDDKRKIDESSSFFGINQTDEEKVRGIMRLNCMKMRGSDPGSSQRCVHLGGNLAVAAPFIVSTF